MGYRGLFTVAVAAMLVTTAVGSSRLITPAMVQEQYHSTDVATGLCAVSVLIHGYKCQEFTVETKDGYILSVQRIPEGRAGGGAAAGAVPKQPVLLQHGFLVDGSSWVLNSPEESLPMILADNGFDVWIVNTRGTAYSRRHVSLDTRQQKYWDWSWDEIAAYDLPAAIDFVYTTTGKHKINYVGHSLGTLVALTSLSERNQIDKLRSASLLSPIAYLSHMKTGLGNIAARSLLSEAYKILGIAEFDPLGYPVKEFVRLICAKPGISCFDLIAAITGKNCCLNTSSIDLYIKSEPQPTATKNVIHLAQTVRSGILSKYDYGNALSNIVHYGQFSPPIYNLANIPHNFPLFLSYGGNDYLSDTEDVNNLLHTLRDHDRDKITVHYVPNYGHVDFVLGLTAKDVVFNQVVAFLNNPVF
ncbi:triacylglycerol lipase 2-like [Impatiens glandulifera]|uniref:triacylglycerol lipase 2-like n=1 Tax=Impatiens glandulifera TaxID=253017 RepID=UPI001FB05AA8|nr:triacylglycerol lipase 2-like [Impatiens glandulifera]